MSVNLDVECSVYRDATDNYGRFVDVETGECIQRISIREFCLAGRWKSRVEALRALRREHGPKAKGLPEYARIKQSLPAATLSGLFEIRESYNKSRERMELKSRITSNLLRHTGFISIDIDEQDNRAFADMQQVIRVLRHRPEVALLMQSCSGSGYFALVPLAFPDRHKEQFAALLDEYSRLGIMIDRKCGDVTRVRFASYDDNPYVNVDAVPYDGIAPVARPPMLAPKAPAVAARADSGDALIRKVEALVSKLERNCIDITGDYGDWIRIGFALASLPGQIGRAFFHRVSQLNSRYDPAQCDAKFNSLVEPERIGIGTFFSICRDYGVTFKG